MNPSSLTFHLLRKDLRRQWPWLALYWIVALLLPFLCRTYASREWVPGWTSLWLTFTGCTALGFLIIARIIQLDAPGTRLHFLSTRPVSRTSLLSSKLWFIALFLITATWATNLGIVYLLKIPVSGTDIALILFESAVRMGALFAAVIVASMLAQNLAVAFALIGAACIAFPWLDAHLTSFLLAHPFIGWGPAATIRLAYWRSLVFFLGILLTSLAAIICRFRARRLAPVLSVLALGFIASLVALECWPARFAFTLGAQHTTGHAAMPDHIKINFTGKFSNEPFSENALSVGRDISVIGVDPPYFAGAAGFRTVATLKSGRKLESIDDRDEQTGIVGDPLPAKLSLCGVPTRRTLDLEDNALFNYIPQDYPDEDFHGARLTGVLIVQISRLELYEDHASRKRRQRHCRSAGKRDCHRRGCLSPASQAFPRGQPPCAPDAPRQRLEPDRVRIPRL